MPRPKKSLFDVETGEETNAGERVVTLSIRVPENAFLLSDKFADEKKILALLPRLERAIQATLTEYEGAGIRYVEKLEAEVKKARKTQEEKGKNTLSIEKAA
jgi:hypothetical protein